MKNKVRIYEIPVFRILILLVVFGTIMIYSSSQVYNIQNKGWDYDKLHLYKHISRLIISLISLIIIYNVRIDWVEKYAKRILYLSWIIMIWGYVSTPDIDTVTTQRTLWIFGRPVFTTSDFARLALIIYTASFINKHKKNIKNFRITLIHIWPYIGITLALIFFQPDLSSTFIIGAIIVSMLLVAGLRILHILSIFFFTALIAAPIILYKYSYMLNRLLGWSSSFQADKASEALANGKWFGVGIGNSELIYTLPAAYTDYILAIIGEELGFISIIILFIIFIYFYLEGIKISKSASNIFSSMLALGITFNIFFYFLINSAYVIGLLPETGLAVPFISFGGSHTIFSFISVALLMNISKYTNIYKNKYLNANGVKH